MEATRRQSTVSAAIRFRFRFYSIVNLYVDLDITTLPSRFI